MFHSKSESSATPGKGRGETIPLDQLDRYMKLKSHKDWRRTLDDAWVSSADGSADGSAADSAAGNKDNATWKIDGRTYASVVHYYQSAKFKYGFPDFAQLFALESGSDLSKDVALARAAGGKSGKIKGTAAKKEVILRPKTVVMDPDFYPVRARQERVRALTAKFESGLRPVLLDTQRAKLTHYIIKQPAETDVELMQVRAMLQAGNKIMP
jgi:predicted NAD-dependent protein-ADP-ribosyltransferase YbiA (DUF1768 family)